MSVTAAPPDPPARFADRVRRAMGKRSAPTESVADRVEALRRFLAAVDGHLPPEQLARPRAVVDRAGERLALSRDHTVVALAGATGSGKSSLFNALAGLDLSTVGLRRPTTGVAHACVWGPGGAGELLDWLDVPRRFERGRLGHDGVDDRHLRGLVLLDLPDFDSVESSHRVEVDRLLALVDLVVWVLDPQKYADRVVHRQYLEQFRQHRDVTVVVLNQVDLLTPADAQRCLDDLGRLLRADGLDGVAVLATSALGPPGLAALRDVLAQAVATRQAALGRLAADVDVVVTELAPLVDASPSTVDPGTVRGLTDALGVAAGVPVVAAATEKAYAHRAIRAMGWPPTRALRRLRPDPLSRLRLGPSPAGAAAAPTAATSLPPAAPAASAAVGLALRSVAERAGGGLPAPWRSAMLAAARSRRGDLTDALDVAIARTDLGVARRPVWWRVIGALQWLTALVALAGLLWLGLRLGLFALGLPGLLPAPHVGRLPLPTALLLGGLLAGLLVSVVVSPVVRIAARRSRARAVGRMRAAVEEVATEMVVVPVTTVLDAYAKARNALRAASAR